MNDKIAVISLDGRVNLHEYVGESKFDGHGKSLEGMNLDDFFKTLLTHHHTAVNKEVMWKQLNTWYCVALIGQDGELRGKPKKFRHTMPENVGGTPFWLLERDIFHQGEYSRYILRPLMEFECVHCGEHFERYEDQVHHNVCLSCLPKVEELLDEFQGLARELEAVDDAENPTTQRGNDIVTRMDEINNIVLT